MTEPSAEGRNDEFVIARCPGCGAVPYFNGRPHDDEDAESEIEGLQRDGLVIEYHSRAEMEVIRPTLGECTCEDLRSQLSRKDKELTALRSAADAHQWQPIDTAPKDGTEVDLWGIDQFAQWGPTHLRGPRRYTNCRWAKGSFEEHVWHHRNHGTIKATHWMQLPDPPESLRRYAEARKEGA